MSGANECWVLTNGSDKLGYKEFIQYLYDEEGIGTYEKWRGGAPVQREKISPEEALKKARNYLESEEFVTASYLIHFSGELKQKSVRSVSLSSKQSTTGVGFDGSACGCIAIFAIVAMLLLVDELWGPAIIVILIGIFVGRFMTSQRNN